MAIVFAPEISLVTSKKCIKHCKCQLSWVLVQDQQGKLMFNQYTSVKGEMMLEE